MFDIFLEYDTIVHILHLATFLLFLMLGWQLSNCGFFLENQRQFFHGTK